MNEKLLAVLNIILDKRIFDDDDEFQTVFGFDRKDYIDLRSDVVRFSGTFKLSREQCSMIRVAINNINGYPHYQDEIVEEVLGYAVIGRKEDYDKLLNDMAPHMGLR